MGAALGGIPIILVISLLLSPGSGSSGEDGPPFYELIVRNGFFTPLAALGALQVFLLPLAAALLSGDAIAGEAATGTLRYLLVRPVGRLRLILSKYAAAVVLIALLILWVTIVGLVAGGAAYGWGPMPTLSGSTLSPGAALLRIGAAACYIATGMGALAAVGVFASTLSDSAPGASVATVALAIVSQILESLSALAPIHTFLISERWLAFVDLFRDPIVWGEMAEGLVAHALYAAVFVGLAGVVLARKDVMS